MNPDRLFVEKIVEHPEYKTADAGEKAFFKSQCKEVIPQLEKIKASLLRTYQKDYEVGNHKLVSIITTVLFIMIHTIDNNLILFLKYKTILTETSRD
jgi:hypothetical protein